MIELRDVAKSYGGQQVLKPLSLALETGQTHVLLGPSGCGKTTLLRLILGLTTPDQGEVFVLGRSIKNYGPRELSQTFGYIVQEGGLYAHLTAEQNILLPMKVSKQLNTQTYERLNQLVEMVHLPPGFLKKYPKQLSGGQRQRVALLRGLIHAPPLLLMDEPMSALDPLVRAHLQIELKEIFSLFKQTVVLVTHDLREASLLGHQIYLMGDGEIIQSGRYQELKNSPQTSFVKDFIHAQLPEETP